MARYTVLIDGADGAYGVVFPDLPGCTAMGETIESALANAVEAARDWVEVAGHVPAARRVEDLRNDSDVREALASGASLASVPLVRATGRPIKANLSLDSGVLAAIDDEAARRKLTRSAFVELMARHVLPTL